MLTQQTLEKLYTMKLNGMADAFRQQQEDTDIASLSFEERFALLVDQQWIWKETAPWPVAWPAPSSSSRRRSKTSTSVMRGASTAGCCAVSPASPAGCGSIRTFFC